MPIGQLGLGQGHLGSLGGVPERISVDGVLYERLRSADSSYLYDSLNQPLYGRVP